MQPRQTSQPRSDRRLRRDADGFTLLEVMAAVAMLALLATLIAPNLYGLVPEARLDGSARALQSTLQLARSDGRIQAKPMVVELDLDRALYRTILPPEDRLTSDDEFLRDEDLKDSQKDWIALEKGVRIAGVGDIDSNLAEKGLYRVQFDAYGQTSDQVIHLQLEGEEQLIWTLVVQGLTGKVDLFKSMDGNPYTPDRPQEGNF